MPPPSMARRVLWRVAPITIRSAPRSHAVSTMTRATWLPVRQYLSFTVTPSAASKFETVTYSKQSYEGQGPRNAAVRTSLDGFAANVASVSGLNPGGLDQITFNISNMPITSSQVEFRIYFFNATGQDWADLVSTNRGGTGLILTGELTSPGANPTQSPVGGWNQVVTQPTTP